MASELFHERVTAQLFSVLSGIDGETTYWYTAQKAARVDEFVETDFALRYAKQGDDNAILMLREDPATVTEETSGEYSETATWWAVMATQWNPSKGRDPWDPSSTLKNTIVARMHHDIHQAIALDVTLGGLVENAEVINKNFSLLMEGWAIALVQIRILYTYLKTDI